jgi:hypothetical protein
MAGLGQLYAAKVIIPHTAHIVSDTINGSSPYPTLYRESRWRT